MVPCNGCVPRPKSKTGTLVPRLCGKSHHRGDGENHQSNPNANHQSQNSLITFDDIDLSAVNAGLEGLSRELGIESKVVLQKETGEMIKTLVKISPPEDPGKTRQSIETDILSKFEAASDSGNSHLERNGKAGPSGILWYKVDQRFLRGVAPADDKRQASVEDLGRLRHDITQKGRTSVHFKAPRRHQKVLLTKTILTKRSTVRRLIARVKTHVGRLKAGWLTAAVRGPIHLTGSNMPPQYVTRHQDNAKGTYIDGLGQKNPEFTIINRARGIGQRQVPQLINAAARIRAKAMKENLQLFLRGKKKLSDYVR
jgi:hypothetical protein